MKKVLRLMFLIILIVLELSRVSSKNLKEDPFEPTSNSSFIKRFHESAGKPEYYNDSIMAKTSLASTERSSLSLLVEELPTQIKTNE